MRRWGKPRKYNTGRNLPSPTLGQQLGFLEHWDSIVPPAVQRQARRDKTILYGARAVNAIVGPQLSRPTKDFDVYSRRQKRHAVEIEQHIDQTTGTDMAYVTRVPWKEGKKRGVLFRVMTHPEGDPNVDYSPMPQNIGFVTKKGIRYETLQVAKPKYQRMLRLGMRPFHAHVDLARIEEYERIKKLKKQGWI